MYMERASMPYRVFISLQLEIELAKTYKEYCTLTVMI